MAESFEKIIFVWPFPVITELLYLKVLFKSSKLN